MTPSALSGPGISVLITKKRGMKRKTIQKDEAQSIRRYQGPGRAPAATGAVTAVRPAEMMLIWVSPPVSGAPSSGAGRPGTR